VSVAYQEWYTAYSASTVANDSIPGAPWGPAWLYLEWFWKYEPV